MSDRDPKTGHFKPGHKIHKLSATAKAKKLAIATAEGTAIGEQKGHEKKTLMESLREHIGKMIDRLEPEKVIVWATTTLLVYSVLRGSEGFVDELRRKVPLVKVNNDSFGLFLRNTFGTTLFATQADIDEANKTLQGFNLGSIGLGITPEMLLSVLIAYLLVYQTRAVAEAMKTLGGSIISLAKSLGGV